MNGVIQPSSEMALQASEYRYRSLFQAMAASFWEIDVSATSDLLRRLKTQGVTNFASYFRDHPEFVRELMRVSRINDVNDQTVSLFAGGDRAAITRSGLDAFWPQDSTGIYADCVLAALAGQSNYSAETRLRKISGEVIDVQFTACFPSETVSRDRLLIGVIDISERKKAFLDLELSETRYYHLFNSMGVACYQLDIRGLNKLYEPLIAAGVTDLAAYIEQNSGFVRQAMDAIIIVNCNDSAVALIGAESREAMLGPITPFWWEDDCEGFKRALASGYRGNPRFETETKHRTVDGRKIEVLFTVAATPKMRQAGFILVSLVDITARVHAQAALEKVQTEFAHAARLSMLGELTASLAHEVNQPLAAIAANAAACLRWLSRPEPDIAEITAITRRMAADAQRAGEIISRIRLMATRRAPEKLPVSVNGLIEEAILFLRHEMQAQGVTVTLDLDRSSPAVTGDRTQLQQVVVNLAMNAIQAMAQGGVERRVIRISSRLPDNCQQLRISVQDSGPGVPDNQRDRLFESFYSTKTDGMGMGLPICRSIIEKHGGEIWVEPGNVSAAGACFSFTLPTA